MDNYSPTSFLELEFDPDQSFQIGQQIFGKVILYSNVDLQEVGSISLNLFGEEQVVFNVSRIDTKSKKAAMPFTKTSTIIDYTFQVANYAQIGNVVEAGGYVFPFRLLLPAWLPRSSLCVHAEESVNKKDK